MKIALGADHKGKDFKEKIKRILVEQGNEVTDFGTDSDESVDYPDFGLKVAHSVASNEVDLGIAVCWTGNGMNIAANKVKGVRAGLALNPEMAYLTRLHNDANVLTLAAKFTPENDLEEILGKFLSTDYEGGRHNRRIDKIRQEEKNNTVSCD